MATPKKVKLGPKAGSFFDAVTRLKVSPNQVIKATAHQTKSEKFQKAIAHRWLIETDEEETKTKEAPSAVETGTEGDDTSNFAKKTIPQLIEYIEDNYEIDEEEMEKVRKMKKDDLVAYVEKLEEEDEE